MPFSYEVKDADTIVFKRLHSGCGRFMFISVGALFTCIGAGIFYFSTSLEMPLLMFAIMFPLFGLTALVVGIRLPHLQRRSTPDSITFDNRNGRVQVDQHMSDIKTGFIYYDEIKDFIVKAKSDGDTSSRSTRTRYTYHVHLEKKDGGQWELLRCGSERDAAAEAQKLRTLVRLNVNPQRMPSDIHRSRKYTITDGGNKAEIRWRNPLGWGPFVLFCFCIMFGGVAYTIFSSMKGEVDLFFYAIGGFILIVFVIVIGGNILKMIKNAKTAYSVVVSDYALDYFEKDTGGRIKKNIQFLLSELHAISFTFDTDQTYRKIFIYTREQFQKNADMKPSFSLEFIREVYNFHNSLVSLDMQELTAVEALAVENFLQERIRDIGRTQVA